MSHWFHPAAERDLAEAAVFYHEQASLKVANAFVAEVEHSLEILERNQRLGSPFASGLRAYLLRRFPYSLVYRESDTGPRVYAVAHHKRKPGYWQSRL